MIDEVSDVLGWNRKHAIKALNGKVSLGKKARRRGSKASYSEVEKAVIVGIWKYSERPCGTRLKQTLPLWLDSYQARHGSLEASTHQKILSYSPRTLDRITAPHRSAGSDRLGRKTGRASNRIKKFVPIRCGPGRANARGLATELGVGRDTVEAALQILEGMGCWCPRARAADGGSSCPSLRRAS